MVEVDLETGYVAVRAHAAVDDCGTVLNRPVVEGQQHGGAAAGIGQALFESVEYDEDGTPRTTSFGDYLVPSAAELPHFTTATMDIPTPLAPNGAKGIGENGAIRGAVVGAERRGRRARPPRRPPHRPAGHSRTGVAGGAGRRRRR